jgi:hypothetical protein
MYDYCSKLVSLSNTVKVTDNRETLGYYEICPLLVNHEYVTFYSTCQGQTLAYLYIHKLRP